MLAKVTHYLSIKVHYFRLEFDKFIAEASSKKPQGQYKLLGTLQINLFPCLPLCCWEWSLRTRKNTIRQLQLTRFRSNDADIIGLAPGLSGGNFKMHQAKLTISLRGGVILWDIVRHGWIFSARTIPTIIGLLSMIQQWLPTPPPHCVNSETNWILPLTQGQITPSMSTCIP